MKHLFTCNVFCCLLEGSRFLTWPLAVAQRDRLTSHSLAKGCSFFSGVSYARLTRKSFARLQFVPLLRIIVKKAGALKSLDEVHKERQPTPTMKSISKEENGFL